MNKEEHVLIGIVAFAMYTYVLLTFIQVQDIPIILGGIGVVIGSLLPDLIEMPESSGYRRNGHSTEAMQLMVVVFIFSAAIGSLLSASTIFPVLFIVSGFSLGYSMHLFADASTPGCLPG